MKKTACVILVAFLLMHMSACRRNVNNDPTVTEYKIAVITKPLSESRETFETAQQLKEEYGDTIVTATYPHNYDTQPEQTVAAIAAIADDPNIRVMIFAEAVNGTAAGIKKVRETRNDILIITGMTAEDATEIAPLSDLCLIENKKNTGTTIVEQAIAMGAKTFVYITCQNDLANSSINTHGEKLKETCASLGLPFVEALAPDPSGSAGVAGTQNWLNVNIPLYVEEYGENTAFYATNEAMSVPLVRQVAACGAILPQLCDPSPYHGYPEAFDIDLTDHEADTAYLLRQIKSAIASYNNEGRMAAWSVPKNLIVLQAGVDYSLQWCKGTVIKRCHRSTMTSSIRSVAGSDAAVGYYTDEKLGKLSQSFAIQDAYYTF